MYVKVDDDIQTHKITTNNEYNGYEVENTTLNQVKFTNLQTTADMGNVCSLLLEDEAVDVKKVILVRDDSDAAGKIIDREIDRGRNGKVEKYTLRVKNVGSLSVKDRTRLFFTIESPDTVKIHRDFIDFVRDEYPPLEITESDWEDARQEALGKKKEDIVKLKEEVQSEEDYMDELSSMSLSEATEFDDFSISSYKTSE